MAKFLRMVWLAAGAQEAVQEEAFGLTQILWAVAEQSTPTAAMDRTEVGMVPEAVSQFTIRTAHFR